MLTKLIVKNFKRFDEVEIELGKTVVSIGPNNSGKTAALQALALWNIGVTRWQEKYRGKPAPEKKPAVAISRRDLIAVPVPHANLLWRNLHVRNVRRVDGKQKTSNVRVDILVEGVSAVKKWSCGIEFDYANEESFYCRPLRISDNPNAGRMPVPAEASEVKIAFLPPMSGLTTQETSLNTGAINVRIGEGRTAEVLRNLCYQILLTSSETKGGLTNWNKLTQQIKHLFGVQLNKPEYIAARGEIVMSYQEEDRGPSLDLSAAGRGLHQTLLLLAYLYSNPRAVLLLDEPNAHLEILRQREIYQVLVDTAHEQGSQIIAASHSEVLLKEAGDRDVVIAFVGKPHRIDDRGSQVLKSLKSIGFEHYYLAEKEGWILYLEGATDLAILRGFAKTLTHKADPLLERPFVHYIENKPLKAQEHFYGLREAKPDLVGIAIFDRLDSQLESAPNLRMLMWSRREIENYLFYPEVLVEYAAASAWEEQTGPLFAVPEEEKRKATIQECIDDHIPRAALRDRDDPWWSEEKASEYLARIFEDYFKRLNLPNIMMKSNFHDLVRFVPKNLIIPEVIKTLDAIVEVAKKSNPQSE